METTIHVGVLVFYVLDANNEPRSCVVLQRVVDCADRCAHGGSLHGRCGRSADLVQREFRRHRLPDDGGVWSTAGGVQTHPQFSWTWQQGLLGWDSVDSGVVILASEVTDKGYAALPAEGLVDTLAMMTDVDIVGYGVQFKLQISGDPYYRWARNGMRYYAPSQIVASNNLDSDMWLKLTANPGQGKGGICFGDSGGPDLLGGTNIILATNSFVPNSNCAGVDYSNRVDRAIVLDWVNGFLQ
jgi:hypothetical protein